MDKQSESVIAWFACVFSCLYCGWEYFDLSRETPQIILLYANLDVTLPASTRFLLQFYTPLYQLMFLGIGVFIIAKEFLVNDKKGSFTITLVLTVLVLLAVNTVTNILLSPIFIMAKAAKIPN